MIEVFTKKEQAYGEFNDGEIIENKPIGFPMDGGKLKPYSNLFYWAHATATTDSTIGLHPHKGFEIISVVLNGSIKHYDTLMQKWIGLEEGAVQVIQSGSGVSHSEAIQKDASIFQIWIDPDINKALSEPARYKDYQPNCFPYKGNKKMIIGGDSPVQIKAEGIEMFQMKLEKEVFSMKLDAKQYYSFYILSGEAKMQTVKLKTDDFLKVFDESQIKMDIDKTAILFCISSPKQVSYPTYF